MASQGVSVEGLNALIRNVRRVDAEHPKALKGIHQEIAEPVAGRARSKARRRSGRMASTIKPYATARMARVGAGARTVYTGVQHYGWPAHNISPNPFLTDAITELQSRVLLEYSVKVDRWIAQAWENTT